MQGFKLCFYRVTNLITISFHGNFFIDIHRYIDVTRFEFKKIYLKEEKRIPVKYERMLNNDIRGLLER